MTIYVVVKKCIVQETVFAPINVVAAYTFKSMAEIRAIEENGKLPTDDVDFTHEVEPVELI